MEAANTILRNMEGSNLPASHLAMTVVLASIVAALHERGALDIGRLAEIVEENIKHMDGPVGRLALPEVCMFKVMLIEMTKPAPDPDRMN